MSWRCGACGELEDADWSCKCNRSANRVEELEAQLARWKTDHTAECQKLARSLIEDQCRESIDRVTDLEDRIATMLSLVQDHSEMIENFDAFKARVDAAAQDGGI